MSNYPQEGFITMEQYMAQFTGEEPAQIREHNRVVELEREVERWQKNARELAVVRDRLYEALESKHGEWFDLKQRVEELERELMLVVNVAYKAMDTVILDRCALGKEMNDWTVDGVSIGDVRKVIAMYEALNSE